MSSEGPVTGPEQYRIHSMVREIATRTQRMKAPVHHRLVQRFAGGRIIVRRTRPVTVMRDVLVTFLPELKKATEDGRIVVKTMTGGSVDLDSLTVSAPVRKDSPLPKVVLDSAANDKTYKYGVGEKRPLFEGSGVPGDKPPALNVKLPLSSSDTPIHTSGSDPARARALAAQGGEKKDQKDEFGEEQLDEGNEDEEVTSPDALNPEGETVPGSKRGRNKKSRKE